MHHKKKDLGKDHIEGKESRSYGRQGFRTLKRDIKIEEISIEGLKLD